MKKITIFLLLLVYLTENSFSYTQKTKTINYNIKKNVSEEYTGNPPNLYRYEFSADHDIGYWVLGKTEYVSGYSFPLDDLPPEEYIISCKLEIIFDEIYGSAFRAYVKELPNTTFSNDASEVFNEIKDAEDFFYFDYPDTANRDITSKVIENISTGFIKFGLTPINQYQYTNLAEIESIKIIVKYYDYAELIADNNFTDNSGNSTHGSISVGSNSKTAPFPFTKKVSENVTLQAIQPQGNNQNQQMIWHTGLINPSEWKKNGISVNPYQSYTFTVTSNSTATYMAFLRKNYKIIQNEDYTEFDNLQTNTAISYIVEQNSGTITTPASKTVNGRTYKFSGWTDDLTTQNTRSITPSDNKTFTAIYKLPLRSTSTIGFSSNSQRKIVRTSNGGLHMVYESMGSVWYSYSSNGGSTWTPEQRVNPYPSNAKSVSIAESNDGMNNVYVVYQADRFVFPSTCLGLNVSKFVNGNRIWDSSIYDLTTYTYDTKPVIGVYNNLIFVVLKPTSTSQLKSIKLIIDSITGTISSVTNYTVTNSTSSSQNPSFIGSLYRFFLAYQNSNTQIKYCELIQNGTIADETTISTSSGFTYNINPSISAHDDYPVISWSGYNGSSIPTAIVKRKTSNTSNIWSNNALFENGAASYPTNNNSKGSGNDGSIIAWSNMYNAAHYVKFENGSYSTIKTLPTTYFGHDLQIGNGEEFAQIKAVSFYRSDSAPYEVRPASYNFNTMQKISEDEKFNYSRMLVLTKNNSETVYQLGNIKLNGESIKFNETKDTTSIKDSKKLGEIMSTELMNLSKESNLVFSESAYLINREKTNLSTNGIELKLELVKNNGEVVSQIREITYSKKDTTDIKTYFKIDCSNLKSGQYLIRVSSNFNEQVKYDISDCLDIEYESVNKNNLENVELNIEELPRQYSLSQNYPNPFNPITTINYQLPKDEHVTLKVYDMLGKEIITLVNEFKTSGNYNIKFDGSNLSSGVYFYKIEAGSFSDTKKLILMK